MANARCFDLAQVSAVLLSDCSQLPECNQFFKYLYLTRPQRRTTCDVKMYCLLFTHKCHLVRSQPFIPFFFFSLFASHTVCKLTDVRYCVIRPVLLSTYIKDFVQGQGLSFQAKDKNFPRPRLFFKAKDKMISRPVARTSHSSYCDYCNKIVA